MSLDPAEIIASLVLIVLAIAGYYIVRDWSKPPAADRSYWLQLAPYGVVLAILGFAAPVFWGIALIAVGIASVGDIQSWFRPIPQPHPFDVADPITGIQCHVQVEGRRARQVKAELLPPDKRS
ncbi:MAG: hypothetical protein R3E01_04235 [Pirellulaceae bacterium]